MKRKEFLEEEIKNNPQDPFNYYLLALELTKENPEMALNQFKKIAEIFPDYLPNYYTYAKFLIDRNLENQAKKIIKEGIIIAQNQQKNKTEAELNQLLDIYF